jgi:hypothetical protein
MYFDTFRLFANDDLYRRAQGPNDFSCEVRRRGPVCTGCERRGEQVGFAVAGYRRSGAYDKCPLEVKSRLIKPRFVCCDVFLYQLESCPLRPYCAQSPNIKEWDGIIHSRERQESSYYM